MEAMLPEEIKHQVSRLELKERRDLIASQTSDDPKFQRAMARKIDDTDPSHWISLEDLKKRYAQPEL